MQILTPHQAAIFWSSLSIVSHKRYKALIGNFGSLEVAFTHLATILRQFECKYEVVTRVLTQRKEMDIEGIEHELAVRGIQLLTLNDPLYPKRLHEVEDAPPFLYALGDLSVLEQPCIGVVGTRRMSQYGKRVTEQFVAEFVRGGMTTVSGLARGVDSMVAEVTMAKRGRTVAVLGQGLGYVGPRPQMALMQTIVERGGLILSEFPLFMPPDLFMFPMRNRIIAGLTEGTVVIEAPESSGALITARLAHSYNRPVFAVPGPIFDKNFAGCHELLVSKRALIAPSPADVLRELQVFVPELSEEPAYAPQNLDEASLLKALTTMPQPVDELVERSKLLPASVAATLTMLELAGAARNLGGGLWVRA